VNQKDLSLDVEQLRKLAGYAHWIPVLKGFHQSYLALNYPGWDWNQIIPQLIKEKIIHVNSVSATHQRLAHGLSISNVVQSVTLTISEQGIKATVRKIQSTSKIRNQLSKKPEF
jgi:hypothetical protein